MEQYLIVSDIHGRYSWLTAAIQQAGQVDGILFLGDGWRDVQQLRTEGYSMPIFPVQGNCDLPVAPVTQTLELAGHTLLLCHGHTYHVKDNLARLAQAAKEQGAEGALFGHTCPPWNSRTESGCLTRAVLAHPGLAAPATAFYGWRGTTCNWNTGS